MPKERNVIKPIIILITIVIISMLLCLVMVFLPELRKQVIEKIESTNSKKIEHVYATLIKSWPVASDGSGKVRASLTDDGVLTIFGEGEMTNEWEWGDRPWIEYRHEIKSVIIQNGVTNIGQGSFEDCSNITKVEIASSVTKIGNEAFKYCRDLTSLEIPSSVTTIEDYAFEGCDNLRIICECCSAADRYAVKNGIEVITKYDISKNDDGSVIATLSGNNLFIEGNGEMDNDRIENFCDTSWNTFGRYGHEVKGKNIKYVTISNGVTNIGQKRFMDQCPNLEYVNIPKSVQTIDQYAFYKCTNLNEVLIKNPEVNINKYAFAYCENLTSLTIPNTVTYIGAYAFLGCTKLTVYCYENSLAHQYCIDNSIKYELIPKELKEIKVTTPPTKTIYYEGEDFDSAGMVVTAYYDDGTSVVVTDYTITNSTGLTQGPQTITISYSGKTTTQAISVIEKESGDNTGGSGDSGGTISRYLTGLNIITPPTKTQYVEGQSFQISGMVIYSVYSDGYTEEVPNSHFVVTNGTDLKYGQTSVTITYCGQVQIEQSITVIQKALSGLEIKKAPDETTYVEGDYFRIAGAEIWSVYNDGYKEPVPNGHFVVTNGSKLKVGQTSVTITYCNQVSVQQPITVNAKTLTSISVTTVPTKTEYIEEQNFNASGMVITAKYDNGTSGAVTGYSVTDGTNLPYGKTSVTISYTENGVTKTTTQAIKVVWDLSYRKDGSVVGELLSDGTLKITGSGEMLDWLASSKARFHADEYIAKIKRVQIGSGVTTIGSRAFKPCINLVSIEIPNTITKIKNSAFEECTSLQTIVIPSNVTSIEEYAFYGCTKLTNITLSSELITIGDYAFENCIELVSVTIPEKVTNLGEAIFMGCSKLTEINVNSNNTKYCSENGIVFSKSQNKIIIYPAGKTNTTYTITSNVQSIGDRAFIGCTNLTSIKFNGTSKLINIGEGAFGHCTNLKEIEFPESLTTIQDYAFYGCTNLEGIEIWSHVVNIGKDVFSECDKTAIITSKDTNAHTYAKTNNVKYFATKDIIVDGYILIEETGVTYSVFKQNVEATADTYVVINEETEAELSDDTLLNTNNILNVCGKEYKILTSWDISKNQDESIKAGITLDGILLISGEGEMKDWTSNTDTDFHTDANKNMIKTLKMKGKIKNIGNYAFDNCSKIEYMEISESIEKIGNYAFRNCSNIKYQVRIPYGVKEIGEGAYYGSAINDGYIPYSVTKIGKRAFFNCKELYSVDIQENVTEIGNEAFGLCTNLDTIEILNENILLGTDIFWGVSTNPIIICKYGSDVHDYAKEEGDKYVAIKYNVFLGEVEGVKLNTTYAQFKENIETNTTYSVYDYSYVDYDCVTDETIMETGLILCIGNNVSYSREYEILVDWDISEAQDGSLTASISRNDGILTIEGTGKMKNWTETEGADYRINVYFPYIRKVEMEDGITYIGDNAFKGCYNLEEITIPKTVTEIGKTGIFDGVKGPVKYYVKCQKVAEYVKNTTDNTEFSKITTESIKITKAPTKVNYIEDESFIKDGMIVEATYSDGTKEEITSYIIRNGEKLNPQQENVAICYIEDGKTLTAEQKIKVIAKVYLKTNLYEEKQDGEIKYVTNIKEKTTIENALKNIETNGTIEVYKGTNKITDNTQYIATDMVIKITLVETETNIKQELNYIIVVTGDLNGDGQVRLSDLSNLKLSFVGSKTLDGAYKYASDINGDGNIKLSDLSKLKLYLVGKDSL